MLERKPDMGASLLPQGLAFDAQIDLGHAATNGEHTIAGENRTASKQAPALPVRKPQFRLVQRVLAVDPTGDAIADKGALTAL